LPVSISVAFFKTVAYGAEFIMNEFRI